MANIKRLSIILVYDLSKINLALAQIDINIVSVTGQHTFGFLFFIIKILNKNKSRKRKNIFCHRSDNTIFLVDFDQFCEKTKMWSDQKCFVTLNLSKHQICAQVKHFQIEMFIFYFDQFLEKKKKWRRDGKWLIT